MKRKQWLMQAIFVVLCAFVATASVAAQPRLKLNVVYPAISGINAPLWYSTEQNLFHKYGLDVELIYIPTALQVTRVVLTGDSQIAFSGGAPVVNVLFSMYLHPPKVAPNPLLWVGMAFVAIGASLVLYFKPQG